MPTGTPYLQNTTLSPLPQARTPERASTPKSTLSPIATKTMKPTPTYSQATLDAWATIEPVLPICEGGYMGELSPDGNWITDSTCESKNIPRYLLIKNLFDRRKWRVNFDHTKYDYLFPIYWSKDGKYLYITQTNAWDGGGLIFYDGESLLRLNLISGESTEILAQGPYNFSFSKSGKLAYIAKPLNAPQYLKVLDLHSWEEQTFSLGEEYCGAGQMLWSLMEDRIIFEGAICSNENNEYYNISSYSLIQLDLDDGSLKVLISSAEDFILNWISNSPYFVTYSHTDSSENKCWEVNWGSSEINPIICP